MTLVVKNPLPRLTRKRLIIVFLILLVGTAIALPSIAYWTLQRNQMHSNWDLEARYAQQFLFHTDSASGLLDGNIAPWNNETVGYASNELAYAVFELDGITVLDNAHGTQLYRISYAIQSVRVTTYLGSLNSSARTTLGGQIDTLGDKFANAYNNWVNYTSESPGGPPFWYSGPTPPDENLLQSAVNTALAFQNAP